MTSPSTDVIEAPEGGEPFVCPDGHGHDRSGYCYHSHGCRCGPCVAKARGYQDRRRRMIAYGRWEGLGDATTARAHLATITESGVGVRRISELSGLADAHLRQILSGEISRVTGKTEALILSVSAGDVAAGALVDAVGTRRRLQALVACGWTVKAIAEEIGIAPSNTNRLFVCGRLTRRMAETIADSFDRIWNKPPPVSATAAKRSRKRASQKGWVTPLAWDDIDTDPHPPTVDDAPTVDASAVEQAVLGDRPALNRAERHETLRRLHSLQWSDNKVAAWIGVSAQTVLRDRRDIGLSAWDSTQLTRERAA